MFDFVLCSAVAVDDLMFDAFQISIFYIYGEKKWWKKRFQTLDSHTHKKSKQLMQKGDSFISSNEWNALKWKLNFQNTKHKMKTKHKVYFMWNASLNVITKLKQHISSHVMRGAWCTSEPHIKTVHWMSELDSVSVKWFTNWYALPGQPKEYHDFL